MSGAVAKVANWETALSGAQDSFVAIASRDQIVEWQRESMFALQALQKNSFLRSVADSNPASLRNAIINVAACGITLNPASQYVALVPRDGAVCLDVMYRGLIKIATDAGSIRWVQAELVHEKDKFIYRGKTAEPTHEADPFAKDRGGVVGVYCVAKTVDGDVLTEVMSSDEVCAIRDRSEFWKKKKAGPWSTDPGEMMKKTVIKRARKTWPESKVAFHAERMHKAVALANETDGYTSLIEEETTPVAVKQPQPKTETPKAQAPTPPAAGGATKPAAAERQGLREDQVKWLTERLATAQIEVTEFCMVHGLMAAPGVPLGALVVGLGVDMKKAADWIRARIAEQGS